MEPSEISEVLYNISVPIIPAVIPSANFVLVQVCFFLVFFSSANLNLDLNLEPDLILFVNNSEIIISFLLIVLKIFFLLLVLSINLNNLSIDLLSNLEIYFSLFLFNFLNFGINNNLISLADLDLFFFIIFFAYFLMNQRKF